MIDWLGLEWIIVVFLGMIRAASLYASWFRVRRDAGLKYSKDSHKMDALLIREELWSWGLQMVKLFLFFLGGMVGIFLPGAAPNPPASSGELIITITIVAGVNTIVIKQEVETWFRRSRRKLGFQEKTKSGKEAVQ